ncbi:hypothetical protein AA23498_0011 [Acetobacter nitrogenifigens DSM 23921 = NBRC 105050]|uniref:Uncharacterized protein n=1 Tax=Acetobacter nitrogenifigens DSM 23921 = NBRC 105050 TaxID=1120919 RepID=A0A511X948_9PROT|nr:hypothetical protein [Acetobacter nitrogenifigens]GBQ86956.1 hypothetical protein AA23498_0011 [Acetobacter nitrogenifigens DSM 23921 = NBRC 105050]GEN59476.1 hypothetical protein ANI02nite_13600 [Acetobacter nitrogenifigens DSM 23921 = NBRC 105050]
MSETSTLSDLSASDLAGNERAVAYLGEHGCKTVEDAFALANILHTDRCVAEAARLYRRAYDLHSKQPHQMPPAHTLLHVSLLCELKSGETPADDDLKQLRALSIPYFNYITGIQAAWRTGDFVKAARVMGNCYDEFHTGEECDCLYLEVMRNVYRDTLCSGANSTFGAIPRKIYMYWDQNPPEEIEKNFSYHRSLQGVDVKIFDQEEAAQWLYDVYGVEARNLFLSSRHPAEAADFLRVHVIQQLGGWWLDADIRLKSEQVFFERLDHGRDHVFLLTNNHYIHNDFFGSISNSPILGDILLSLYRNSYLYPGLYIPYKTGPGVFNRAVNRAFHADFNRLGGLPSMRIYDQATFNDVIEEFDVKYKFEGKTWHTVNS